MSVINRTMKTLNVPNGDDTICYEITDEQARNGLAGKADKVSGGTAGNLASVGSGGSLEDSGKKAADFLPASEKGEANGVAELDGTGRVPASQLPGYVDDVVEGYLYEGSFYEDTGHSILIQPESGKIYVDKETNKTYRWSGTTYVEISSSLALGETASTAYRGDRGKAAYDHSQLTNGNPHNVTKSDIGLGNVDNTSDADKPISTATQTALNAKQDTLTFDTTPTSGSTNPVTSGGIYTAVSQLESQIEDGLHTLVPVTLAANGWISGLQTVTVAGVLADETEQMITIVPASTSRLAFERSMVEAVGHDYNTVTFSFLTIPKSDLSVYVIIDNVVVAS